MVLTPSTMNELGTIAPDFTLSTPDKKEYSLSSKKIDRGLLVIFMCNHCPYVIHIRKQLVESIKAYQQKGIEVVAINSNNYADYPDDRPEKMLESSNEFGFTFPYLVDEDQKVAQTYRAACTPDFFLYNSEKELVYRGQFDEARPGNTKAVTGQDLTAAIDNLVSGKPLDKEQKPSMGCNIKWKQGLEPDYFALK